MRDRLKDQMLKAGLIDEKALKKAKKAQPQQKVAKSQRHIETDENKLLTKQALADKAERDRALSQQQKATNAQREIAAQIRQMIEQNKQNRGGGDIPYNFTDGKIIKKLFVTKVHSDQLSRGQLAIVKLDDKYELIPARAAKKISERDVSCVILCNTAQATVVAEDDPYADYKIPDDLTW